MNKKIDYKGWELDFFDQAQNFRDYQWKLFKNKIKKDVLEVGPGNCVFLERYNYKSKKIHLFEPSVKIRNRIKKKFKKFKKVKVISKYSKSKYDCIVYLDVLEHIKDDKTEVFNAYNRLKKKGHLIISVPAFQHLYTDYDKKIGHYRRYNKKKFNNIFNKLKIKKYTMKYFDCIGYFLILFSKYLKVSNKVNFKGSIKIWNFLIPISKILDIFFNRILGKSLMVIIQKN
tara:strand:- start:165 stop:851 length:687 start_codon:yes stop_codon:yes gene_type:complete